MDNNIRITPLDISNSASQIRVLNANLDDVLNSITNDMNSLSSVWGFFLAFHAPMK